MGPISRMGGRLGGGLQQSPQAPQEMSAATKARIKKLDEGVITVEPMGLSPEQASAYSGLSTDFLKCCRMYGHVGGVVGPPYKRVTPKCILYLRTDLDDYLQSQPSYHHVQEEPRRKPWG